MSHESEADMFRNGELAGSTNWSVAALSQEKLIMARRDKARGG